MVRLPAWLVIATTGLVLCPAPAYADGNTFYFEESTDFTNNGCPNSEDLNAVTGGLTTQLLNDGWTGFRYKNAEAWPQDLAESCSSSYGGGLDSTYGDTATLTVFGGHGNENGQLFYGYPHDGKCHARFNATLNGNNLVMRLGSMSGNRSGYGVYLSSCSLNTDSLVSQANHQWLNQQFGYHNSPSIGDNQVRAWWNAIGWPTNDRQAWLDEMEDRPGLFTGDNSPIVVSYGTSAQDCLDVHNKTYLGEPGGLFTSRFGGPSCGQGQPAFHYCATLRDNGDGPC
jgi:hypothetical protein